LASKILSAILIIALLGAIGTLSYVVATPITEGEYTEFYILGLAGKAGDYPTGLVVGEEGKVIVGIVNREHQPTSYNVEVRINNIKNNSAGPVSLANNEKWEQVVTFIADKVGTINRWNSYCTKTKIAFHT